MFTKGISRRWFLNTIGIVFVILVIFIVSLSFMVQTSVYNGIELAITGRVDELLNWLSASSGGYMTSEFTAITRDYIENYFQDKDKMEIMALSRTGQILITSTGFEPDQQQAMPDYDMALQSEDSTGNWIGSLNTGEKVMAITRAVRDENGTLVGSIRYMVSLERADQQTFLVIIILVLAGAFIMLLLTFSGVYFIRSIVVPVRQVSASARKIAQGDFAVRIEKAKDDEIGQLCDTINDMAVELGAAEKMKNDFISSVSHELRTPLTAINGWGETILEDTTDDPAQMRRGIRIILNEARRLSTMVEELLEFSKMEDGRFTLHMEQVDLQAEFEDAIFTYRELFRQEGIELTYESGDEDLPPIPGDSERLKQVFCNVLDNAAKHGGSGKRIDTAIRPEGDQAVITIRDYGPGIPEEELPHVKYKFYKGSSKARGSGIGLAVCDEIVTLHGGTLEIGNAEGGGCIVTIRLPIHPQTQIEH